MTTNDDKKQREEKALKGITKILNKYNCNIDVYMILTEKKTIPQLKITAKD